MLFSNHRLNILSENELAQVFVGDVLKVASLSQASDIHFEPYREFFRVRMRLDGILKNMGEYEMRFYPPIAARAKLLGGLDIAERRAPQDGALSYFVEHEIESHEVHFRISSIPTLYGEKIVFRRLSDREEVADLYQLGMDAKHLQQWERSMRRPSGITLVTGPTGSGKSTTLFATLKLLNQEMVNISTIEDPVEYKLEGVNQMQINSVKLSFASALRSMLRQDPDIIMVGEMRDKETADIAMRASLTGHKVFSTVHTNDTAGTLTRLIDMGVEPYLVASSLNTILAQRLVRKTCQHCTTLRPSTPEENLLLKLEDSHEIADPKGCQECNHTGYKGRTGVYEMLMMDEEVKRQVMESRSETEIKQYAIAHQGMKTVYEHTKEKVLNQTTTVEELRRVIGEL